MFYCDACGKKRRWPIGLVRSNGACEACGRKAECSDVPSSQLPEPKKPRYIFLMPTNPPPYFENPDFERFHRD